MNEENDIHEKIHFTDLQKIDITDVELKGRILDIGGGGEGIIGLLKGERVIAIDKQKRELEEAPSGEFLKIVMDAKDLKFLDESFDTVTIFFTIMYIPMDDRLKVFEEVYRVLKAGGELVIWDLIIPEKGENSKDFYGAYFEIILGEETISTGYATHWNKQQDLEYFTDLGIKVGFKVLEKEETENRLYIRYNK